MAAITHFARATHQTDQLTVKKLKHLAPEIAFFRLLGFLAGKRQNLARGMDTPGWRDFGRMRKEGETDYCFKHLQGDHEGWGQEISQVCTLGIAAGLIGKKAVFIQSTTREKCAVDYAENDACDDACEKDLLSDCFTRQSLSGFFEKANICDIADFHKRRLALVSVFQKVGKSLIRICQYVQFDPNRVGPCSFSARDLQLRVNTDRLDQIVAPLFVYMRAKDVPTCLKRLSVRFQRMLEIPNRRKLKRKMASFAYLFAYTRPCQRGSAWILERLLHAVAGYHGLKFEWTGQRSFSVEALADPTCKIFYGVFKQHARFIR